MLPLSRWWKSWRARTPRADAPRAVHALGGSAHPPAAPWRDDPARQVAQNRHWVYVAVRAIAGRVAGTPLTIAHGITGERVDWNHPLAQLLREVNPFDTAVSLWMKTVTFLELTGNAYWHVANDEAGQPAEIWVLPAPHMRVLPDPERFVAGYEYRRGAVVERFDAAEIIHLKYPSAESVHYGGGPLAAAAESVAAHFAMKEAEKRSFENGAFPGLALMTDEKLAPDTRARLEEQFSQHYAGPQRAGRAIVLEQGLKLRPFTFSPREMDFLESSRAARDEILAVFGVPPAVVGMADNVNRASAEAMLWTFAENTILPKLRLIEAQLTQDVCRRFGEACAARFENPVPTIRAEERLDMIARLEQGVTSPDEERSRLGLPPRAPSAPKAD